MPVLDGSFEAFVTNLGKYNEGELVGEWVQFPTTEDKMKEVFERIGIGSKDEFVRSMKSGSSPIMTAPFTGLATSLGNMKTSTSSTTSHPGWMRCPALSLSILWQSWIAAAMK